MRIPRIAVPLAAALAAAASPLSARLLHPVARQITPSAVPAACQSRCASTTSIYDACIAGKESRCLSVCDQARFDELVDCMQCSVDDTGASRGEVASLGAALAELGRACRELGMSVTGSVGSQTTETPGVTIAAVHGSLGAATLTLTGSSSSSAATGVSIESADTVQSASAGFPRTVSRTGVGLVAAIMGWAGVAFVA